MENSEVITVVILIGVFIFFISMLFIAYEKSRSAYEICLDNCWGLGDKRFACEVMCASYAYNRTWIVQEDPEGTFTTSVV